MSVYSSRFIAGTSEAEGSIGAFLVPMGYTAVVRCVSVHVPFLIGVVQWRVTVNIPEPGPTLIYDIAGYYEVITEGIPDQTIEMRQVVNQGEYIQAWDDNGGLYTVVVSGYLLDGVSPVVTLGE